MYTWEVKQELVQMEQSRLFTLFAGVGLHPCTTGAIQIKLTRVICTETKANKYINKALTFVWL